MLIQQRAVHPLHEAVRLGPSDAGGAVLDLLKLEEQFLRMGIGPSTELPPVIREDRCNANAVFLEER